MWNQISNQIIDLLANNQIAIAKQTCNNWLIQNPQHADAYHLLGLIYIQEKDLHAAIQQFLHATQLDANQPEYHNSLGCAYRNIGSADLAATHYQEAIRLKSNFYEAYNNLASLLYKQARIDAAIHYYEKALRLNPNYFAAHFNLANCFTLKNSPLQAINHYLEALKIQPLNHQVAQNLSMCYLASNQLEAALPLLESAVKLNPQHPALALELAKTYLDLGKSTEAMQAYMHAQTLNPNAPSIYHNLAILYLRANDHPQAIINFKQALHLQPSNAIAQHMLNSLLGKNSATAPAQHIELLFDQYASNYDIHTKEKLNYQVPTLLRNIFSKYIQPHAKTKNIIDLGCGTGQCGILFHDLANFMLGIDLSFHMLTIAKKIGAYNALCQANLNSFIPGCKQYFFDLAIAGDVLVYMGDLNPFFANCTKLLKPGAKFLFTVEKSNNADYILLTSGRYAHSKPYIERLASKYAFVIEEYVDIIPRENNGQAILGNAYVLCKP